MTTTINKEDDSMNLRVHKRINVLGYNVFASSLDAIDTDGKHILINTISPNSYGLAIHDKEFEIALKNSDILVVDGIGIAIGSILLNGKNIKKIAGQDCFDYLIAEANRKNWKVFFLGSTEETLNKIVIRLRSEYPNVFAASYSPPFVKSFSEVENATIIRSINLFEPDILFVGMTAPKQEKWAYQHRSIINSRIISTIGNVFDWYAGNSSRPSKIWINLRLEWLIRIFMRPEILRRNTKNQLLFLRDLFKHIFFMRKIRH
jgi:N-acetylglucosaminyldiphosphoundecaprenol N-acetyl-beta-D-mannosaminyltransferase